MEPTLVGSDNGTFYLAIQKWNQIKWGGRGNQCFQAAIRGTKCFKGRPILSENIGPPGPFSPEIFGPGVHFLGGPIHT